MTLRTKVLVIQMKTTKVMLTMTEIFIILKPETMKISKKSLNKACPL